MGVNVSQNGSRRLSQQYGAAGDQIPEFPTLLSGSPSRLKHDIPQHNATDADEAEHGSDNNSGCGRRWRSLVGDPTNALHVARVMNLSASSDIAQLEGFGLLMRIAEKDEQAPDSVGRVEVMKVTMNAMRQHSHQAAVLEAGFQLLLFLVPQKNHSKANIIRACGVRVIIQGMQQHEAAAIIQELGCNLLADLSDNIPETKTMAVTCDGVPAVVKAMLRHPQRLGLQRHSCCALRQILCCGNQGKMTAEGGIEAVTQAMALQRSNVEVQRNGCMVLSTMVSEHYETQSLVHRFCGLDSIRQAMATHIADEQVQESGCLIIRILSPSLPGSYDLDSPEPFVEECQAVVRALRAFPDSKEVQEQGCYALLAMAKGAEGNAAVKAAGGDDAAAAALQHLHFEVKTAAQLLQGQLGNSTSEAPSERASERIRA